MLFAAANALNDAHVIAHIAISSPVSVFKGNIQRSRWLYNTYIKTPQIPPKRQLIATKKNKKDERHQIAFHPFILLSEI